MLSNGKLKNMEVQPEFDDFTFLTIFVKVNIEKFSENERYYKTLIKDLDV